MGHSKKLSELTVEQALEETVAMWEWLAENPEMEKHNWPGLLEWDLKPAHYCFLCEITDRPAGDCASCPLYGRWGVRPQSKVNTCMEGLFERWCKSKGSKRVRYARLLADRARTVLAEIRGGNDDAK